MFERFTEPARQVVIKSQEVARGLRHNYIGSEHMLLGLLSSDEELTRTALDATGMDFDAARQLVVRIVGVGEDEISGQIPFTPRAKKILELSLREALSYGHNYIGPEHILLGLVRENEGVGARLLVDFDVDLQKLRDSVEEGFGKRSPESEPKPYSERSKPETQDEIDSSEEDKEPLELGVEGVPTHPDRPAKRDDLGRERLAAVVAERIRRARSENTEAPVDSPIGRWRKVRRERKASNKLESFLVHIHAPWGAGKSSLLNFLAADLRNRVEPSNSWLVRVFQTRAAERRNLSQWIVVDFSAWEHQRLDPPWWWLLATVRRDCSRELWRTNRVRWLSFAVRDIVWQLWNARILLVVLFFLLGLAAAAWRLQWFGVPDQDLSAVQSGALTIVSALGILAAIAEFAKGAARVFAVGSAGGASRYLRRARDPLDVYRRRFRWLVRSSGRPIAVFIDDLDRCRPSYVVELLEGIQTLFLEEPVTYVIAADRTWLCESFARVYAEFEDSVGEPGRSLGYLFLEKTFQVSLEIPPMGIADRQRYWELLISFDGASTDEEAPRRTAAELSEEFASSASLGQIAAEAEALIESGEDPEEVRDAAVRRMNAPDQQDEQRSQLAEFAPLLEPNPRSMKRLMNAYGVERDRLFREGYLLTRTERRQLALLTILRLRWPELADRLRRHPEDARHCVELGEECPLDHPHAELFDQPEFEQLFDGSVVETTITEAILKEFPEHAPDPVSSLVR